METSGISPEQANQITYSLQAKDFSPGFLKRRQKAREKAGIQPYKFGERVTRDNFVNMLLDSFDKSRGQPSIQKTYLTWLQVNTGFDFIGTIKNYIGSGGWDSLSKKEQAHIIERYEKRPHSNPFHQANFNHQVEGMANAYGTFILSTDLRGMSQEEFVKRAFEEHKTLSQSIAPTALQATPNGLI